MKVLLISSVWGDLQKTFLLEPNCWRVEVCPSLEFIKPVVNPYTFNIVFK